MSDMIASTYEVLEQIGSGGGGDVFLANHLRLGKKVVLKADKRKITTRSELLRREVDVLKDLSHPYIPQVYDFFIEDETVYTVMDYIVGESLDKPLKRGGRFSQPQVIKWAKQLLEALCYLHSPTHGSPPRGYVHSDIKPANLMLRPNGDICLIDFNIALAIGEKNVIGCSAGYASPEHYGLDFSSGLGTAGAEEKTEVEATAVMGREGATSILGNSQSAPSRRRVVIPDSRSDIYSVGATLYHLLCGKRPARDAREVMPLSDREFSPQLVDIITKAMNPNPDLRFQTAEEMLRAFGKLRENDPRTIKLKRGRNIAAAVLSSLFILGAACSFIGLKRMESYQQAARIEAEQAEQAEREAKEAEAAAKTALDLIGQSQTALDSGDAAAASKYAADALALDTPYRPQAQYALTDALGVYRLGDGYRLETVIQLPSAPFKVSMSPGGGRAAALCGFEALIYDLDSGELLVSLPTVKSALADLVFVDDDTVIYAAEEGITAYSIAESRELWQGGPATMITLSADASRAAAIYAGEDLVRIYETADGEVAAERRFDPGMHIYIPSSQVYADPNTDIFALNSDGTMVALSFEDGSVMVLDAYDPNYDLFVLDASDYTQFEGGFCGDLFAYSALGDGKSSFDLIDAWAGEPLGGFDDTKRIGVTADESGVYISKENVLSRLDTETYEETLLAYTGDAEITGFTLGGDYILVACNDGSYSFFDYAANLLSREETGANCDYLRMAGDHALAGTLNTSSLRTLKLESHPEADLLSYDPAFEHDEARISADGRTAMLFWNYDFWIYDMSSGELTAQVELDDPDNIYDQQFRRDESGSYLEVIYMDGLTRAYSAADGSLLWEKQAGAPDASLYEEFQTDKWRIESPLHEAAKVYDLQTGELIAELGDEGELAYVTQLGEYVICQYVSSEGAHYAIMLDGNCQQVAYLPNLSDITGDTLIFDYPSGKLRQSRVYSTQELLALANN